MPANTYRTPHFNMPIPTGNDPGPDYANNISAIGTGSCLYLLGEHTHDGMNSGPLINIAGQIIQNDLSLDGYNASNIRAIRFNVQTSPLTGISDLNELYDQNGDLYFIDGNGNQIQITKNGGIYIPNANPALNIKNITNTDSPYSIQYNTLYTTFDICTSVAPVTMTLPIAATVVSGQQYQFFDVCGNAANNPITIQVAVGSGNTISGFGVEGVTSVAIVSNGGSGYIYTDGIGSWYWTASNVTNFGSSAVQIGPGGSLTLYNTDIESINSVINLDATTQFNNNGTITNNANLVEGATSLTTFTAGSEITGHTTIASLTAAVNASTINYTLDTLFYNNSNITYTNTNLDWVSGTLSGTIPITATLNLTGPLTVNTGGSITLAAGNLSIGATSTVAITTGATFTGPIKLVSGDIELSSGTDFIADSGSTLLFGGTILAPIGTSVHYGSVNVPLPASGNVTLTTAQYCYPVIDMGGGANSLSGNVTIIFPNIAGTWDVLLYAPGIGTGFQIEVTNGTGGYNSYIFGHNYDQILVTIHVVQTATTFTAGAMTCTNKV